MSDGVGPLQTSDLSAVKSFLPYTIHANIMLQLQPVAKLCACALSLDGANDAKLMSLRFEQSYFLKYANEF